MVTVLHMPGGKDPDIYYGIDQKTENRIIGDLKKDGWRVERASEDEWYGQDNPKYTVHHWNVTRGNR